MILMNLFAGQERDADVKNRLVDTVREERVGQTERVKLKCVH